MTTYHDNTYLQLVRDVLENGIEKKDRTGTGTLSVFARQMRFDLSDGTIPLLTTKKMHIRSVIHELLWFLMGTGSTQYLEANNVTIWDEWKKDGKLGPVYGAQWRAWKKYSAYSDFRTGNLTYEPDQSIDQIKNVIHTLKMDPDSRRMLVNCWNVGELDKMALLPCHYAFQFYATKNDSGPRSLSCMINQRSCDVGLGVPFNIVQYSMLTRMIAEVVDMTPGELIWNGGDVHIYTNHVEALNGQLERSPYPSPTLTFGRRVSDIDKFKFEDFVISNYESHPTIKMEVSV
jgi:thymidylate synthase